jgi:hypothetical protein
MKVNKKAKKLFYINGIRNIPRKGWLIKLTDNTKIV